MRSFLKTAGFILGCWVWLLAGLTLLGPLVGERFLDTTASGPRQPLLSLICPARVDTGGVASLFVRIDNHSGQTQTYSTDIAVQLGDETTRPMSVSCDPPEPVPDGKIGTTSCSVGPITRVTRAQVTVWAEGENAGADCAQDCKNSYRSGCVILPDVWSMLLTPGTLFINAIVLVLGLILVGFGALIWRSSGPGAQYLMSGFFIASAAMLAMALYQTFDSIIAPLLIIGPLPEAILVAYLWLRGHPSPNV